MNSRAKMFSAVATQRPSARGCLLIPEHTKRRTAGGRLLPSAGDNIFTRIIRNPLRGSTAIRERQCAEMLAGLLINAPAFCKLFCEWLANLSGCPIRDVQKCDFFSIATEQSIHGKRDDLRIEGWQNAISEKHRVILWTIEVKVNAWFHFSLSDVTDGSESTVEPNPESVNQLITYDKWLMKQQAKVKAGFVLAIDDVKEWMPENLLSTWKCSTWTQLGVMLRDSVLRHALPREENFLCRHVLGFIADNLWRTAEMPDARIDFEDVAFLRASVRMADDCEEKIHKLTLPIEKILREFPIGTDISRKKTNIFGQWGRDAWRKSLTREGNDGPVLSAGFTMDRTPKSADDDAAICVWIETPETSAWRGKIKLFCEKISGIGGWRFLGEDGWNAMAILPFVSLMVADDQQIAVQEFVTGALSTLNDCGLTHALSES